MKKTKFIFTLMLGCSLATMARAADTSKDNCEAVAGVGNCTQIGDSGTYYALSGEANNQTMTIYGTKESGNDPASVPESAFRSPGSTFPEGVKSLKTSGSVNIGEVAFEGAEGLTSVDLTGVQTIGVEAFYGATGLTSVDLTGVQTIGADAFYGAEGLTSVDLTGVQTIGADAFYGATSLTSVVLPDSFFDESGNMKESISEFALGGSGIQNIYCPEGASCQNYFKNCPAETLRHFSECISISTWEPVDSIPMTGINITSYKAENGKYVLADGTVIGTYQVPTPQNTTTRTELSDGSYRVVDSDGKVHYEGKRIYTLEEANEVTGKVNRVTIRYK